MAFVVIIAYIQGNVKEFICNIMNSICLKFYITSSLVVFIYVIAMHINMSILYKMVRIINIVVGGK